MLKHCFSERSMRMKMGREQVGEDKLALMAKQGDPEAFTSIVAKRLPYIREKASRYSVAGVEAEDIVQEALIGLLKAIRCYDADKSSFSTFADLCENSAMADAVRRALSANNRSFADAVAGDNFEELEGMKNPRLSPEEQLVAWEQANEWKNKITSLLSEFEQNALKLYLRGHSYSEISSLLVTPVKAVDNALQRVRRKLRETL